jgi:hypothetical protein
MNLDLLDETYSMVKYKLYFVDIDHTGLTGQTRPANFGCEHMPPVFGKACVPENIHKDQNWLKTMINNASPICKLYMCTIITEIES